MVMIGVITDNKGYAGEMHVHNLVADRVSIPSDIDVEIGYSPNFTRKFKINYWKSGKKSARIRLNGIDSDEKTKQFMEMGIFVSEEVLKFNNPETTFTHELVGMKVIENETEIEIGFVSDFLFMPANDVIVIDKGDRYLNIPFIEEFIIDINIKAGFIKINLPNGYEELEELKSDLTGSGND